jgi:hypothetical protein
MKFALNITRFVSKLLSMFFQVHAEDDANIVISCIREVIISMSTVRVPPFFLAYTKKDMQCNKVVTHSGLVAPAARSSPLNIESPGVFGYC